MDGRRRLLITPTDAIDLWIIRRLIERGDQLEAWTTRETKLEGDYIRPDKGKRVKVRVKISVEDIKFDSELGRLRVKGKILESSSEMVSRGSYHSLDIVPGKEFSLWKQEYPPWVDGLLKKRMEAPSVIIVALDGREAGVGVLSGLSLQYFGTVTSDVSGKMYQQNTERLTQQFLNHVKDLIAEVRNKYNDASIVLLGPGKTKQQLFNLLDKNLKVNVIEGFDLTGEDGVKLSLNFEPFKQLRAGTLYNAVTGWIEEAKVRLARNDHRFAMGYSECERAATAGAIDVLLISDKLFKSLPEEKIVQLANVAETSGAKVILLDSSTVLGVQVSSMGGAIALLRYELFN